MCGTEVGAQILNFKAQTQKRKFEKLSPQMQKRQVRK